MDRKGLLDDLNMTLFDPVVLRLSQVTLHNANNVTCKGLRILKSHQIQSVEVKNLSKVSVDELISCFGEWTLNNIHALSVSGSTFTSHTSNAVCKGNTLSTKLYVGLSKLKNLHVLNVSGTELSFHALLNICNDLHMLSSLDISNCSKLESVECLRIRKNTLKSLNMYNLKVLRMEETKQVLLELRDLIHLDISENKGSQDPIDRLMPMKPIVPDLLRDPVFGPNLRSLDISGQDQTKLEDLHFFLKGHPKLEFLGLMLTSLCLDTVFLDGYSITVSCYFVLLIVTVEKKAGFSSYKSTYVYLEFSFQSDCLCNAAHLNESSFSMWNQFVQQMNEFVVLPMFCIYDKL